MSLHKILILSFIGLLINSCGERGTITYSPGEGNFNEGWEFTKDPNDTISLDLFNETGQLPTGWEKVSQPHTANIEPVDSPEKQWQGISRYRKFFSIAKKYEGRSVTLRFGAAMQVAKIYLNGELIETHLGGYLPFLVKLDGRIKFGKQNCILIELDNRDNPLFSPGKPLGEMDFNYYSGLYRNVTLDIKDKLHISDPVEANRVAGGGLLVTYSNVTQQSAEINVQVDVENEYEKDKNASLLYILLDPDGKTVISKSDSEQVTPARGYSRFKKQFIIENPRLWSPDNPELYSLNVRVISNDQPVDSVSETIGIRTFSFSSTDGFTLNGQKIRIRGTNRHQEYPYIGYALSDNAQYRDAWKIKQAGFNFVRCSHYPQSPSFLAACDELGILVMDPVPGWQFFGNEEFQNNAIENIRQMVRRDRNHPSIILWESSLNESNMSKEFMERGNRAVKEELPVGDVYTCGWIDEVYDVFIPARQHAKPPDYWNKYPKDKPLFIAEYGDWEYYAQDAGFNQTAFAGLKPEERTSRQLRGFGQKRLAQQALNYQEAHNDNLKGPAAGDANWLIFDYKRGYAPDIESSGIMDIFRLPKFAYFFYKSQAEDTEPMIYIANYWNDPDFKDVKVYSNCDEVELSLNGKLISRQKHDKDKNSTNLIHPPFSFKVPDFVAGTLEAKGYIAGKEIVKTERKTPGAPAKIILSLDLSGKAFEADKNDIVFVYASVTDAEGTVIPNDIRAISYYVEGDAELVGDNPRKAEAGTSTILLRSGKKPGIIKISATADGIDSGELLIESKFQISKLADSLYPPAYYAPDCVIDWSKRHYKERIREFKNDPLQKKDIVFIGNSITEGGKDWGKRLNNNRVKNRGISGDVTDGVLNRLGEVCYAEPEAVFIMIGINDLDGCNKAADETRSGILKIAITIQYGSPETRVFIQTILPTSNKNVVDKIAKVNKALKDSADLHGYFLIDLHDSFADENDLMKSNYTTDGYHLNEEGYQLWVSLIKEFIHP